MSNGDLIPCDFVLQGKCFARFIGLNGKPVCRILAKRIDKEQCPFCKPERNVTNGVTYDDMPSKGGIYNDAD